MHDIDRYSGILPERKTCKVSKSTIISSLHDTVIQKITTETNNKIDNHVLNRSLFTAISPAFYADFAPGHYRYTYPLNYTTSALIYIA